MSSSFGREPPGKAAADRKAPGHARVEETAPTNPNWHALATAPPRASEALPAVPDPVEAEPTVELESAAELGSIEPEPAPPPDDGSPGDGSPGDDEPGQPLDGDRLRDSIAALPSQRLDRELGARFGRALAHDFSGVRLHLGSRADSLARRLDAHAFSFGRDLVFASDAWAPRTEVGRATLAHELHHVAQFERARLPAGDFRVAGPGHPAEREAERVVAGDRSPIPTHTTAASEPGLATTVLRIPRHLPQTAGGLRLTVELDHGHGTQLYQDLRRLLSEEDLDGVERTFTDEGGQLYEHERSIRDSLEPFVNARRDLDRLRDPARAELHDDLLDDAASLLWSRIREPRSSHSLTDQIFDLSATYATLVELHDWEADNPDHVPPVHLSNEWLAHRAEIFLALVRRSDSPVAYLDMLRAYAADIDRHAAQQASAPSQTARVLIGALFEDDISRADMQAVESLYDGVLESIHYDPDTDAGAAVGQFHERFPAALTEDVLRVEAQLQTAGDTDVLDDFHIEIAEEIAMFLATLDTPRASAGCEEHVVNVRDILDAYGTSVLVVVFVGLFRGPRLDGDDDDQAEDERAHEPEVVELEPEPAAREPEPPAPEPEPEVCEPDYLTAYQIGEWLRQFWTDRRAFFERSFNGAQLMCGMSFGEPEIDDSVANARMSVFTRTGHRVMRELDDQLRPALTRARRIAELRLRLFPPEGAVGPVPEDAELPIEPPPDYIQYFALDSELYYLLDDAFRAEPFNLDDFHDRVTFYFNQYFGALTLYQNSLIRALGLSESMRSSGSEQLLIDEFPDDWAPAVRRLLASAQSKPAWTTDATELEAAVGLDYAVTRLAGAAELADTTLQVRRERELQERISAHLPNAVSRYWRRHPDDPHIQERTVRLSHVWPDPLEWLIDTPPPGTEHLIETYVRVALREFNIGTLRSLGQALAPTAERNDTLELERLISQARALQRDLGVAPLNTALASLEDYNRGQSQFLLMLYVHAATAMSMARGVVTERGHHVRTGTIFNYMMDAANSTTLTGTVRWLERVGGVHSFVEAMARVEASLRAAGERPPADQSQSQDNPASSPEPHWGAGTDLFPWLDALRMGIGRVGDVSQSLQEIEDGAHDPNSPLYHLLAAEAAGGGEARNAALAELGDRLRAADHAEAYVAARLLYASALQVPHLIHEYFKPKQVIDAETVLNTSMARTLLGPIPTPEIRRAQEVVDEYQRNLESNQTQLDRGRHPTLDRELSDNEKRWWESYKAISGRGRLLGEEELQGIQDFGKQLIFMIAIGAISGGVGSAFAGLAGGGTLATLTGMGIELAGITAASRMYGVATTGIRPETSFLEDFAVNVATMGAERLALRGYNAAFSLNPATAQLTRHVAGRLVTEYLATSIVTHAHMVIRAQVTGGPLTNDQIASSYLSNAAFLVAMKGRALLGPTSTAHFRRLFGQRGVDQVRADILTTRLAAHDDAIEDATRRAGEAETQVERDAALRDIEVAMQAKAELLERSRIRGLDDDIADFRAATRLFGSDAARARLFGAINVEPHPNSRDLTYSRGGASVDTIIRHFNEAGVPFRILEGIHGPIFELTAADGAVTRLEPRPAREFGGTSSETFLAQGRSAHEGLLLSGQHAELGDIIAADRQVPAYLRSQLGGGQSRATISAAGVSVRVELRLVDDYSAGTGGHDPGPAQYRLDYRDGQFVATVEVLTRATNDQMGRGVTHEVIEIQRAVELLVEDAQRSGTDLSRYEAHDTIDAVLTRERDARALRPGGEGAEPSADDLGRLAEFRYLAGKMHEVRDALERFPSPDEAAALRERLELLEAEYRRTWRASGLSVDADVLASQLGRFPDSALDASTRAAVEEARVTATLGWESRGGVRALDIQLMLRALHAANPDLVAGVTIHDMGAYYQSALAARAQRIYDAELTRTSDPDLALAAAVESVRAGMGGTSLASWRGRAFEGLSADELNGDPLFRSQYGQMHLLTRNNYPTYDAVSVRGTSEGLQPPDESPRINPDGSQTRRLRIRSQSGTLLFEWLGTNPPTTWTAGGIDVTLWSDKARGSFDMVAGYRATGSAQTPHRHGRMLGTPEFADAIDRSIAWTQQRVTTLQAEWNAGDTSVAPELARMRRRLSGLQHFQTQLETSSGWSNARIDSLLEQLRGSQLDIDAIIDGVYVHAAGGPAPTPGGTGGGATGGGGSP